MKLVSILLLSFITTQLAVGQNTMKPMVNVSYMYSHSIGSYPLNGFWTHELQIGGGVQFNDHFSLQLNVVGIQNARKITHPTIKEPLQIVTLSLSPGFRILKTKYKVSPWIGLDVGTQIWSNGNGKYIDKSFRLRNKPEYSYDGFLYRRGVFFGIAKVLADFKIWDFNLLIGASYNMYYFKLDRDNSPTYIYNNSKGVGLEGMLTYTFPMKKRAAKAEGAE